MIHNFKVSEKLDELFEIIKSYYSPNLKKGSDKLIEIETYNYILRYQFNKIEYVGNKHILKERPNFYLYMEDNKFFFAPENMELKDPNMVIDILNKIIESLKNNSKDWCRERDASNSFIHMM